jgi:hypothetical protein
MRPCIFRSRFSMQSKQGGMKMTSPPMANHFSPYRGYRSASQAASSTVSFFTTKVH